MRKTCLMGSESHAGEGCCSPCLKLSTFTFLITTGNSLSNASEFFRKSVNFAAQSTTSMCPSGGCWALGVCSLYFYPPPPTPCDSVWPAAALWWLWLVSPHLTVPLYPPPPLPPLTPLIPSHPHRITLQSACRSIALPERQRHAADNY